MLGCVRVTNVCCVRQTSIDVLPSSSPTLTFDILMLAGIEQYSQCEATVLRNAAQPAKLSQQTVCMH